MSLFSKELHKTEMLTLHSDWDPSKQYVLTCVLWVVQKPNISVHKHLHILQQKHSLYRGVEKFTLLKTGNIKLQTQYKLYKTNNSMNETKVHSKIRVHFSVTYTFSKKQVLILEHCRQKTRFSLRLMISTAMHPSCVIYLQIIQKL